MPSRSELPAWSEADRDRVERELRLSELAARYIGGLSIYLYWHRQSNTLSGCVIDEATERTLVFEVPNDKGLDAFYHPMAYAAREGLYLEDNRGKVE
jgi:hypothetical protein